MPRKFNISGPCSPELHYMIPAEERIPQARQLVNDGAYFVVHAPRQTGKTTTIRALAKQLTLEGQFAALYLSCEAGTVTRDDYSGTEQVICGRMQRSASESLPLELQPPPLPVTAPGLKIGAFLSAWAQICPRPLVLFLDEIDGLSGDGLRTVLSQIRDGFSSKPGLFPHSIMLCGLRDVRDYKLAAGGNPQVRSSPSPFNIVDKSLRVGDFTSGEVRSLYAQHTCETGQVFSEPAVLKAFELTQGQPWLTNALAREVIQEMGVTGAITEAHVIEAKERLILARATHLDSLVDKLQEPRVRRVIEPIISGQFPQMDITYSDDVLYVADLGLIAATNPIRIANPIYREVIVRVLAAGVQSVVVTEPRSFVMSDGRFDIRKMLEEFADFWRTNGDILTDGMLYHEVAPQLVLMAFLQRVINGGGYVTREYGVGRGRIDLLVRWRLNDLREPREQLEAIELKVWSRKQDPLKEGLQQLESYLDKMGLSEGILVIFDRRPEAAEIEERTVFEKARTPKGYRVTVLRG